MHLFWKKKNYKEFSDEEWESLCDGCGLCCQLRLEDVDNGDIALTNLSCRYLDLDNIKCKDYANREKNVADCTKLTKENVGEYTWLPKTCAYRLVYEGKDLFWWHHLVSGDFDTVHKEGISMKGKLVNEDDVDNDEEYVVEWLK